MNSSLGLSLYITKRHGLNDWISLGLDQYVITDNDFIAVGNLSIRLTAEQMKALGTALLTGADAYHANPENTDILIHSTNVDNNAITLDIDGETVNDDINVSTTLTK